MESAWIANDLVPLEGGWSGETFVAETAGERVVVRIYRRDPDRVEVDAALLRLVRGLVPVPEVLEQRPAVPEEDQPALLVTGFVGGVRGDVLLQGLDADGLARAGEAIGDLAADLGGMPMLRPGPFVDGELRLGRFDLGGLPEYVDQRLPELAHLSVAETDGLRAVAVDAQAMLDTVGRSCLVHSDLNPKNLLLDPDTLRPTALLDWEYAHAGHPFTDLGNLLRFDRTPAYADAVLARYADRRGVVPAEALDLARAADLWALVDLAARRTANPVAARADRLLRRIARTRDPSAVIE